MKLRHNFHDGQRFLQSHVQNLLFLNGHKTFHLLAQDGKHPNAVTHCALWCKTGQVMRSLWISHLTTDEEDAEGLEQRCHPLHEPTSGQVQSSPALVTEPEALKQKHAFVPWTRILNPVLVRENQCKTLSKVPLMPISLWTPRSRFTCEGNTCLCSSFCFGFYVSLSPSLSLTHTPQTHARTSRYTRKEKSLFQFCWGHMTVIFGLLLALLRGEAGVKKDTKSRWKRQQIAVLFLKKRQICV